MKVTTTTGFKFELEESKLDDMRLVQKVRKLQKGDMDGALDVLETLVGGDEGFDNLCTHLEKISDDGIAHSSAMVKELTDILNSLGEKGKKS